MIINEAGQKRTDLFEKERDYLQRMETR